MNNQNLKTNRRSGQALLVSVIMMGGALLGAAAIAGVLMLYQIRQSNNVGDSAKAVFAADAGIEWQTYCTFVTGSDSCPSAPTFTNGASVTTRVIATSSAIYISAEGSAGDSVRSLESTFQVNP